MTNTTTTTTGKRGRPALNSVAANELKAARNELATLKARIHALETTVAEERKAIAAAGATKKSTKIAQSAEKAKAKLASSLGIDVAALSAALANLGNITPSGSTVNGVSKAARRASKATTIK